MPKPLDVHFVLPSGSLILDWAGPAEAFRFANTETEAPAFKLHFVAPKPVATTSVGALLTGLAPLPEKLARPAWVVVVGRVGNVRGPTARSKPSPAAEPEDEAVVNWLQRLRPGQGGLRLVTVCSGALLAASAGLLRGKRVTTHHAELDRLAALEPECQVVHNRVFVEDGELWSSAGVTAGIDLALHLVSDHCGAVVAARVAQRMAVALRRGPDDPQLSPFLAHRQHLNGRLHRLQDAVSRAPGDDWSAQRLAQLAHITPRSLTRLFDQHAGVTPLAYVRGIRLSLAQAALQAGSTVARAAETAGFSSDLQLRRAWRAVGAAGKPSAPGKADKTLAARESVPAVRSRRP